jgi:uncharacterized protein YcfL
MTWRTCAGVALVALAAVGCGSKHRSAKMQADQTVRLTEGAPIYALVMDPQPKHYDYKMEVTGDQPLDVSYVVGATVDEAINLEKRFIPTKQGYGKENAKTHAWEGTIGAHIRAVLVLRHNPQSGPTNVRVKLKK